MIDLESHFMASKASWIPRTYKENDQMWACLAKRYIELGTGEYC